MDKSKIVVSKSAFQSWLEDLAEATRVGKGGDPCGCPIATYIRRHGGKEVSVADDIEFIDTDGEARYIPSPKWASKFIDRVDAVFENKNVNAQQAHALLTM